MFYGKCVDCFMEIKNKSSFQELMLGPRTALAAKCSPIAPGPLPFHRNSHLILYVSCWYPFFPVHMTRPKQAFFKNLFSIAYLSLSGIPWPQEANLLFPGGHYFPFLHFLRCYSSFIFCGYTVLCLGVSLFVLCGLSILCNLKFGQCFLLEISQSLNSLKLSPHIFILYSLSSLCVLISKLLIITIINILYIN